MHREFGLGPKMHDLQRGHAISSGVFSTAWKAMARRRQKAIMAGLTGCSFGELRNVGEMTGLFRSR